MTYLKKQIQGLLKFLARATLKKYSPGIVAITGTVGKTSTKEAIYVILRQLRKIRANSGTFNNELGLPLTILGEWQEIKGAFFWPKVIFTAVKNLVFTTDYPEILVLEYAADKPGDIRYLLSIARPQIGVVTSIGDIPVHVEFYSGPDSVAREKSRIIEAIPPTGFAVLNYDDESVMDMRERTRSHIVTFGFSEGAEVRVSGFENHSEELPTGGWRPAGITFKLEHDGKSVPIRLNGVFGKAQAYAVTAAAAVGLSFGMNLARIAEAINLYQSPPQRMKLISGIKGAFIIDDSYNASPLSMQAAIETMADLKAKRKVAVLGDMLELGKYSIEAHEAIGQLCYRKIDILVTVGLRSKFIADAAIRKGFNRTKVLSFDTPEQARLEIQALIEKGDLILVKGSRAIGLEQIVREIRQV